MKLCVKCNCKIKKESGIVWLCETCRNARINNYSSYINTYSSHYEIDDEFEDDDYEYTGEINDKETLDNIKKYQEALSKREDSTRNVLHKSMSKQRTEEDTNQSKEETEYQKAVKQAEKEAYERMLLGDR